MQNQTTTKQSYDKNGFHIFRETVVDAEIVKRALEGMDLIRAGNYNTGKAPEPSPWNPGDDPNKLCKIEQPQISNQSVSELIRSPAIGELVAKATGAQMVQVWWVQLLYKPPAIKNQTTLTKVGWHRDWTYWKDTWQEGSELLTAWFALSNVEEDSGPMKFIVGSHRWTGISGGDFFSQDISQEEFDLPTGQEWKEVSATMRSGSMSIHNKLVLHGSGWNLSKKPRCSFAIHLRTEKSRPIDGKREGLIQFIDNPAICPIIFGKKVDQSFA